jgi:DNA-binding NarL/FixJ family response regulator
MKKIAVMIADDHPIVRKAIIAFFKNSPHIVFSGEADNGFELIELIKKSLPDIAIIDLEMPEMNGYDTILELRTNYPEIKTIAFTGFLDSINQQRAIELGAFSTVSKTESIAILIRAVEMVIEGKTFHSKMISNLYEGSTTNDKYSLLTQREKQVLNLIAEGKTSKQISQNYNISKWTVDKHRSNIKEKLEIRNFADMVRYAIKRKKD